MRVGATTALHTALTEPVLGAYRPDGRRRSDGDVAPFVPRSPTLAIPAQGPYQSLLTGPVLGCRSSPTGSNRMGSRVPIGKFRNSDF